MFVAMSQFQVKNDMEGEVAAAFLARPRLVDDAPGFLGLEVFTDHEAPSLFYLITRWSDLASFEQWHNGLAHRASHEFIPKGLKLDPKQTRLLRMTRLEPEAEAPPLDAQVRDAAPFFARFLSDSAGFHYLAARYDGHIETVNDVFLESLGRSWPDVRNQELWHFLTEPDALRLQQWLAKPRIQREPRLLLNFRTIEDMPFTLDCGVDTYPDRFVLLGETTLRVDSKAHTEMMQLSNELTRLNREHVRQNRELVTAKAKQKQAMDELETSYWHLRKIQEHMPICCRCHKVRSGEEDEPNWMGLLDYLAANDMLFSHGFCPNCYEEELRKLDQLTKPGADQ
jgi:heme-degrading monooxygenase HmoA